MAEAKNMRLLAQNELGGFGNIGEGISLQVKGGRRILWLAHESGPKNFTGIEVTDPGRPRVVVQTNLPRPDMRSNSLEVVNDLMAVAYQTSRCGMQPAGIELLDISTPETPRRVSFFDCSGPASRGVHQLWFVDGKTVHCSSGAPDFVPLDPKDDQCYRIIDFSMPTKPYEIGRWWYPGVCAGDGVPPPQRLAKFDHGFRAHNTNVYPERPDRAYLGYLDGGSFVLDISDPQRPKPIAHWAPDSFLGFAHTTLPLFDRDLLAITHECVEDHGLDWPKLVWILDNRHEDRPTPIATLPLPSVENFRVRGGRYGAHNLHENRPGPSFRSSTLLFGSYFSGGVRVHDIGDPIHPKEIAYYIPTSPPCSPVGTSQINDVFVDENRTIYAADRFNGGLYILELTA